MSATETKLLSAIRRNPLATQQQLADELGLSRESVAGHIMRLTRQGKILGKGYLLPSRDSVVVLGGANVDISGTSDGPFRSGDSNPGRLHQSAGGVGRNIAENLSRLGHRATLVTLLGRDPNGDWLLDRIHQAGIGTEGVLRHASLPTSTYLAVHDNQGTLVGAIADMGISKELTPERLAPLQSTLVSAATLVVEANLPAQTLEWLATLPLQGHLYADAVSISKAARLAPLLPRLSGLKANRAEARALLNDPELTTEALVERLLAQGVGTVALSLGADGVLLATEDRRCREPVFSSRVISDTGAGDALFAGILHAALNGFDLAEQARFGLGCAGFTLESHQANHPQLNEVTVNQWIAER